jgi:hypothetical protein
MKALICLAAAVLFTAGTTIAAEQTWNGQISDSLCGAKHESESIGEGNGKISDQECTVACVKGGSKYVLVSSGKVYQIANQTHADLAKYAGHTVKLTGEMKGDSITVSKIEMP